MLLSKTPEQLYITTTFEQTGRKMHKYASKEMRLCTYTRKNNIRHMRTHLTAHNPYCHGNTHAIRI